ncbi:secreted frizzled-related protein 2-like [Tiliqua scincoides]|uniref:secreted frizzled-related protein 2-like n=1 Tax=Tiliqua scincoides TaxID=71010 RepID=UPI003462C287
MLPAVFVLVFVLRPATGLDIGLSTKCVAIPKELDMCHDVGYLEMRLPNFMGHTSLAEVIPKSAAWQHLVRTDCHPYARMFLCSLFAPVCLDTFIQPCRSLCVAVWDSCMPALQCQGHTWPSSLNCDRFPADDDVCLESLGKEYSVLKAFPKPTCQTCPTVEDFLTHKRALDSFCANSFVVKVKLSAKQTIFSLQEYKIDIQVEFLNQGLLLPYDIRTMVEQWLLINENCTQRMVQTHQTRVYLIVGTIEESHVLVNRIYHWQRRDYQPSLAIKKWRRHKCTQ